MAFRAIWHDLHIVQPGKWIPWWRLWCIRRPILASMPMRMWLRSNRSGRLAWFQRRVGMEGKVSDFPTELSVKCSTLFVFLRITSFFRWSVRLTLISGDDTRLVYTKKGYWCTSTEINFCFVCFFFFFSSSDLSVYTWLICIVGVHKYGYSAKSTGGRLQLNTHATYLCGFVWSDMVHGCRVYTERTETAALSRGTSHASAVSTPLRWIFHASAVSTPLRWIFHASSVSPPLRWIFHASSVSTPLRWIFHASAVSTPLR